MYLMFSMIRQTLTPPPAKYMVASLTAAAAGKGRGGGGPGTEGAGGLHRGSTSLVTDVDSASVILCAAASLAV
jgi:hypothetical protein